MTASQKIRNRRAVIIGLMSGTSADGIDAVAAEVSGRGDGINARVLAHHHQRFVSRLRERLHRVCQAGTVAEICELNFELGEHFARAAGAAMRKAGLRPGQVAAIASHGQTVHHLPNGRTPSTLQIGEPCVIAERTGITTIADFRVRDMAAGGQGAPLVPYADWALFTHARRPRVIQNLGGIANLTFLPPSADLADVLAFDTGPGNMVMDFAARHLTRGRLGFDRNGALAAEGKINASLLAELMQHPYFRKRPPRTTGREEFGESFARQALARARARRLSPADVLATLTALTAESVADAFGRFVLGRLRPAEWSGLEFVLGGGGAKNATLRRMLLAALNLRLARRGAKPMTALLTHETFGIADVAKEALAFAILGFETLRGRPSNVPGATGAARRVVLGKIVPSR